MSSEICYPHLGFGLGLRIPHYQDILDTKPKVDWFEVITENYLVPGGKPLYFLNRVAEHYPIVMHGVSLSIGSSDPLDMDYLRQVKQLAQDVNPVWISDHLCWTGLQGINAHDLLPLPYTDEAINHVVARIERVQDYLGRRILIENVSSYVDFTDSSMPEWVFLREVAERADCLILLDVNNIYVSSVNHEFDPHDYINAMPAERIQQIHLAGHTDHGSYIIDTHDHDVPNPVWDLYRYTIERIGFVSTMIERDDNIPPLSGLLKELDMARNIANSCLKSGIKHAT